MLGDPFKQPNNGQLKQNNSISASAFDLEYVLHAKT